MNGIKKLLRKWAGPAAGQSLTEMAIATPLLIFLMIGVFEVGWALRTYLVLVNVNREITRFAIRPGYLDFSTVDQINQSYERVRDWAGVSTTGQLELNFSETATGTTTMIISHVVVDTGFPCADVESDPQCSNCADFETNPTLNPFPEDDIIVHPWQSNFSYQQQSFGPTTTVTGARDSHLRYDDLVPELVAKNNKFNCEVIKKGGVPSANNVIVTEMFYDIPQLFGFPLISNPYTDPIPLYTHTTMRLIGASRSEGSSERPSNITEGINTIGPVCFAHPMVISHPPANGAVVNLIANGWLYWNAGTTYTSDPMEYVGYALQFPQMSLNDFRTQGAGEHVLKVGSQVSKVVLTGPWEDFEPIVLGLEGKKLLVPTSTLPGNNPVTVDGFAWVTILSAATDVDLDGGTILATVDTETAIPEACNPAALPAE